MLQGLNDAVVLFDRAGHVVTLNASAERLYRITASEAVGGPVQKLLPPPDDPTQRAMAADLDAKGTWQGQLTRRDADGGAIVVEVRVSRLDGDGTLYMDAARDITANLATEDALRLAQVRNVNLFEAMAVSFWDMDFKATAEALRQKMAEGVTDLPAYFAANPDYVRWLQRQVKVIAINQRTADLFGGGRADIFADITPYWPDASCVHFTTGLLKGMRREASYIEEVRLRRIDGSEFDCLFTATFPPETVPSGRVIVGVIDIDDQKKALAELSRSENRYRTLFETTGVAFFRFDTSAMNATFTALREQGVTDLGSHVAQHPDFLERAKEQILCVDANASAVRLLRAASKDELLGSLRWVSAPDHERGLLETLKASFRDHATYQSEHLIGRLDGTLVPCLWFTVAPPELRGQNTAFVGLIDISEQEAARAAVQAMQVELAHAARVAILGELTASLAHEVAQPLSAIASRSEAVKRWLSRDTVDVPTVRTLVGKILDSVDRATEIVSRIRAMAIRAPFHTERVDLAKLVRDTVAFLSHELENARVAIRINAGQEVHAVEGDRVQLQQLVFNIILNAHQALETHNGADRRITITLRPDGGNVVTTIDDNGPGIPPGDLQHVFESFRTTKSNGMGIGLSVCRSIVERHGGQLMASNLPDGGARFLFRLPTAAT
ncbi:ATP-binding protein [Nitrospirillum sp. BR 11164]|uniref:PAS domain-containing sensor histidine kinase n=1 Tax=Nitrospirillum sp. BR 11164 TaxID=3104324 RepID=UPI002AFDD631|nr:ATP-binding protein [Nitrospirillum sp. BR 11164]MEA1648034.1 ATP-binding protein [Nitrospirillum sp. BR 11164]